ncbi:MAG: sulfur carrier protein ThiS [Candidatus Cloacimonetes bacterium]|nr:sulfur carrier protein ThiS [Candidatus Cloacimonadota bacterium]
MKIMVNSKSETVNPGSILDFISSKGLAPEALIVEHNYKIIKKEEWANIRLDEGDNLELLSFVGGG